MKTLRSWTDDDQTRFFSGTATYAKTVDVPDSLFRSGTSILLDFGDGQALPVQTTRNGMRTWYDPPIREAANIYINGNKAGALWCPPYRLDVTQLLRAGPNDVRIEVANTALNFMSGRKLPDYRLLNLRFGERFQPQDMDKIQPVTSGLVGSIKLVSLK